MRHSQKNRKTTTDFPDGLIQNSLNCYLNVDG
jgi:hypothetical protein